MEISSECCLRKWRPYVVDHGATCTPAGTPGMAQDGQSAANQEQCAHDPQHRQCPRLPYRRRSHPCPHPAGRGRAVRQSGLCRDHQQGGGGPRGGGPGLHQLSLRQPQRPLPGHTDRGPPAALHRRRTQPARACTAAGVRKASHPDDPAGQPGHQRADQLAPGPAGRRGDGPFLAPAGAVPDRERPQAVAGAPAGGRDHRHRRRRPGRHTLHVQRWRPLHHDADRPARTAGTIA